MASQLFKAGALLAYANEELFPTLGEHETSSVATLLLENYFELSRLDFLKNTELEVSETSYSAFKAAIERLKDGEPIQYIIGHGWFYGRKFTVNHSTLIPRGETEELVRLVLKNISQPQASILDVGTGTGCIAITLQLERPEWQVLGTDISTTALQTAHDNAHQLQANVEFFKSNALEMTDALPSNFKGKLDVVVSNPPYVMDAEKQLMAPRVTNWEPHTALFVPDVDPLLFYRSILKKYIKLVKPGGWFFFEINEALGRDMLALADLFSLAKVSIVQDIHQKDRFLVGRKGI
jgi:release factor glutamine methyltransferase